MTHIRIFPRPMMFPNFLLYPIHAESDQSISVGALSQADAAALWDEWKPLWLEHVAKKRAALAKQEDKP